MKDFKVIALTHKQADLTTIGRFHVEDSAQAEVLSAVKEKMGMSELMYLSTCNRVEIIFVSEAAITKEFKTQLIHCFLPGAGKEEISAVIPQLEVYQELDAVKHLFHVASSLDSMVIGEREIITQFRKAYEQAAEMNLSGDFIRLAAARTIETAKRIFTETQLCTRPVSVVSLAYKTLQETAVPQNARVLMVGAGQTNRNLAKFLIKGGYRDIQIFNRTLANAQALAKECGGSAHELSALSSYKNGFDIIVTCTGSAGVLIDDALYTDLLQGDTRKKVVIDLAIPADFDPSLAEKHPVALINVAALKPISEANIKAREQEIIRCEDIIHECLTKFQAHFRERRVELAMRQVPHMVKEIREKAINQVFAKDIQQLDDNSREILEKMLQYVEKKYISGPIKMAKQIMLSEIPHA